MKCFEQFKNEATEDFDSNRFKDVDDDLDINAGYGTVMNVNYGTNVPQQPKKKIVYDSEYIVPGQQETPKENAKGNGMVRPNMPVILESQEDLQADQQMQD